MTEEPREYPQFRFSLPPGATDLLLIRHGESMPARLDQPFPRVDGHADPQLRDEGHVQARRLGERLAAEGVDAIYVSTLRRTQQTAAPLADRLGLQPIVEPDLREVHLGEWEGEVLRHKAAHEDPTWVQALMEQRWDVIPGAEETARFSARVNGAVTRIAAAHPDQRVAVVAHGGVIGQLLADAVGARPFAFVGADNASISQLVVHEGRNTVRRFNDTAHLADGFTLVPEPLT